LKFSKSLKNASTKKIKVKSKDKDMEKFDQIEHKQIKTIQVNTCTNVQVKWNGWSEQTVHIQVETAVEIQSQVVFVVIEQEEADICELIDRMHRMQLMTLYLSKLLHLLKRLK
jgi:hypothetical protein